MAEVSLSRAGPRSGRGWTEASSRSRWSLRARARVSVRAHRCTSPHTPPLRCARFDA